MEMQKPGRPVLFEDRRCSQETGRYWGRNDPVWRSAPFLPFLYWSWSFASPLRFELLGKARISVESNFPSLPLVTIVPCPGTRWLVRCDQPWLMFAAALIRASYADVVLDLHRLSLPLQLCGADHKPTASPRMAPLPVTALAIDAQSIDLTKGS